MQSFPNPKSEGRNPKSEVVLYGEQKLLQNGGSLLGFEHVQAE
jgi:hypothetical protein